MGPVIVVGHEGLVIVWISHRNAVVKATGNHVRLAEVEEQLPWHVLCDSLRDTDEQTYSDLCPPGASRDPQYGGPSTSSWVKVFVSHAKNPGRFPGGVVVVVTFFEEILDDFHDFSQCVFTKENQQPISGGHRFFGRKGTISIHTNTHLNRRKSTKHIDKVILSDNIFE